MAKINLENVKILKTWVIFQKSKTWDLKQILIQLRNYCRYVNYLFETKVVKSLF